MAAFRWGDPISPAVRRAKVCRLRRARLIKFALVPRYNEETKVLDQKRRSCPKQCLQFSSDLRSLIIEFNDIPSMIPVFVAVAGTEPNVAVAVADGALTSNKHPSMALTSSKQQALHWCRFLRALSSSEKIRSVAIIMSNSSHSFASCVSAHEL